MNSSNLHEISVFSTNNYAIIAESPISLSGHILQYIVIVLVIANMIGIGGQINGEEVIYLLKRPVAIGVALFCRFGIMPAIGLGIVELFYPSSYFALGVLSFVLSPTEGLSNLLALLADADLTLGVIITCVNNFASGAMFALWAILFEKRIYNEAGKIEIPFRQIYMVFTYLLLAPAIGFLLKLRCSTYYQKYWNHIPCLATCTIIAQLIVEIIKGYYLFSLITFKLMAMVTVLVLCGFLFSAAIAFVSRHPQTKSVAIVLDASVRNTLVSHALMNSKIIQLPQSHYSKVIPVLASIMSLTVASIAVLVFKLHKTYRHKQSKVTEFTEIENFGDNNCEDICSSKELHDLTVTAV